MVNVDRSSKKKGIVREYVEAIVIAVFLALFVRTFVVQAYKIPSASMEPTLLIGDHILVNKFVYGVKVPFFHKTIIPFKNPERGDIIVFTYPVDRSKDFIKRTIGVEGDTIEIINKKVYINGKPANDPYGIHNDDFIYPKGVQPRDNLPATVVPKHAVFVMGDNRDHSYDSRFWGFVDVKDVKGKAFLIYWSWNNSRPNVRWGRIAQLIH